MYWLKYIYEHELNYWNLFLVNFYVQVTKYF